MSDVTYHLRISGGAFVVARAHLGIERPLRPLGAILPADPPFRWGDESLGTIALAGAILLDAIRFRQLAGLAAPSFALDVLALLEGNCVLSRTAVRDWFFRSVRFEPSTNQVNGEDHSDGFLIF